MMPLRILILAAFLVVALNGQAMAGVELGNGTGRCPEISREANGGEGGTCVADESNAVDPFIGASSAEQIKRTSKSEAEGQH